jgi:hypothetical protein
MNLRTLSIIALIFSISPVFAQNETNAKQLVVFDPLFWKEELKLDNAQCQEIRRINSQYYEKLYAVARDSNRRTAKAKAETSLQERSDEIWETFHPRQRKRWKKMWDHKFQYTSKVDASSSES